MEGLIQQVQSGFGINNFDIGSVSVEDRLSVGIGRVDDCFRDGGLLFLP